MNCGLCGQQPTDNDASIFFDHGALDDEFIDNICSDCITSFKNWRDSRKSPTTPNTCYCNACVSRRQAE